MVSVERILVPVDFSDCSVAALRYALYLASKLEASVDVLNVWEPPKGVLRDVDVTTPDGSPLSLRDCVENQAEEELAEFIRQFEEREQITLKALLRCGNATDEIVHAAEEGKYDLIVLGTHGRTGLSHFFLGSIAVKVVRQAPCPVLTIRLQEDEK